MSKTFTVLIPVRVQVDDDADLRSVWRSVKWWSFQHQVIAGSYSYKFQGDKLLWRDFKAAAEGETDG